MRSFSAGALLIVIGLLFIAGDGCPSGPRLPGNIVIRGRHGVSYFPVVTCILIERDSVPGPVVVPADTESYSRNSRANSPSSCIFRVRHSRVFEPWLSFQWNKLYPCRVAYPTPAITARGRPEKHVDDVPMLFVDQHGHRSFAKISSRPPVSATSIGLQILYRRREIDRR